MMQLPGGRGELLGNGDFENLEECHRDDAQEEGEAQHVGVTDLKNKKICQRNPNNRHGLNNGLVKYSGDLNSEHLNKGNI